MFEGMEYILIGPGRWATTNPELGVPVNYSEISNAEVVVELSHERFSAELSYGTHFFADMEASNMLYIPLFLEKGDYLNEKFLEERKSKVESAWVKVIEVPQGLSVLWSDVERVAEKLRSILKPPVYGAHKTKIIIGVCIGGIGIDSPEQTMGRRVDIVNFQKHRTYRNQYICILWNQPAVRLAGQL